MEKVIKPGIGLGAVKFGMTREQVSEILGDPTEIDVFTDDESGANVESWHYDEDEASFAFDEEADWRLTTIAVSGDHYEFAEIKPIGMPIEQLITQLESAGFEGLEEDDEDDQVFYSFELIIFRRI